MENIKNQVCMGQKSISSSHHSIAMQNDLMNSACAIYYSDIWFHITMNLLWTLQQAQILQAKNTTPPMKFQQFIHQKIVMQKYGILFN